MGPTRFMAAVACGAMLLAPAAARAQGTPADRTTFVTFSGPVSIPGKTLPAGTYTFRLADSPANQHIVQIFDRDQSQIFATLLAVPAERNEATGDPVITFKETPADRPPAVRYWYYAGDKTGNEFIYPRSQAMAIARASGESVMSVDTDSTNLDDWKSGTPSRVTPEMAQQSASTTSTTTSTSTTSADTSAAAQQPTSAQPTPPAQPATTPQPTPAMQPMTTQPPTTTTSEPRQAAPTTAPTTAPTPEPERPVGTSGRAATGELPHTASEVPLVGLIGVLALAGAFAIRARRATV